MEWFTLHKGSKQDDINDPNLYKSVITDENVIEQLNEYCKKSWKPFVDSYTKSIDSLMDEIDTKVQKLTSVLFDKISGHLTSEEIAEDKFPLVVARCNFSELDTFEQSVKKALRDSSEGAAVTIIKVSARTTVKSVIDDARLVKKNDIGVVFIEQAECLSDEFVNKLFWLLKWFKVFLPVVACVSSDISSFSSLCSLRTLKMFEPLTIDMVSSHKVFNTLLSTITTSNSTVLQFSGAILTKLRQQFFLVDTSVIEAKRIIKFAMINHNIENPTWITQDSSDFNELVKCYWEIVGELCEEIKYPCKFLLHEAIQNSVFFEKKENDSSTYGACEKFESWKRNVSKSEMIKFAEFLKGCRAAKERLSSSLDGIDDAIAALQEAQPKSIEDSLQSIPAKEVTPPILAKKTMSMSEFKRQNELNRKNRVDKLQGVNDARTLLMAHIEKSLKKIVRPFTRYQNSRYFVVKTEAINSLSTNPHLHMEKTLIKTKNEPIAIAYRTLQERNNWKATTIKEWYSRFERELPKNLRPQANAEFFSSLSRLEAMGIVKAGTDRQKGRVIILHFPVVDC